MSTLYHGTTRENWNNIQKEGWLGGSHKTVWNCSLAEVYFFDLSKAYGGMNDEPEPDILINQTFSQAQIAAAIQNFQGTELVVLRFEVPDEYVTDDYSCENADESVTVDVADMCWAELTGVYVDTNYKSCLRLFYIASLMQSNHYLNLEGFTELELEAAKILAETDCYIEELFNYEWDTELEAVAA